MEDYLEELKKLKAQLQKLIDEEERLEALRQNEEKEGILYLDDSGTMSISKSEKTGVLFITAALYTTIPYGNILNPMAFNIYTLSGAHSGGYYKKEIESVNFVTVENVLQNAIENLPETDFDNSEENKNIFGDDDYIYDDDDDISPYGII